MRVMIRPSARLDNIHFPHEEYIFRGKVDCECPEADHVRASQSRVLSKWGVRLTEAARETLLTLKHVFHIIA
jgi:hypothetical protein